MPGPDRVCRAAILSQFDSERLQINRFPACLCGVPGMRWCEGVVVAIRHSADPSWKSAKKFLVLPDLTQGDRRMPGSRLKDR